MSSVSAKPQEVAQPSGSFDAAPVVTTSTTCSEWWHNPPTPSERDNFQAKTVEEAPPEGSGVQTPCLVWVGAKDGRGVPQFWYRNQSRSAHAVHAHFNGFRPEGYQVSYCGRKDCLSHRSDSAEKRSGETPFNNKTVQEVLPLELSDWDGFQVHRADGAGCTGDMVCYSCGGENTPGNTFRVTKVDGLVVSVVKVFDPITSKNDTICDGCWDEGEPVTKGTHLQHEGTGYGLRNNGGPTKIRDMENLLIASIDAGLPMELVVGCTSVADRIVEEAVASLKEDLHNLWLNADYEKFVGTSTDHSLRGVPVGWDGVADPAYRQQFLKTMDEMHERLQGHPAKRQQQDSDEVKPKAFPRYQQRHTQEEIEAHRAARWANKVYPVYEPYIVEGQSLRRQFGTWKLGEPEEIKTFDEDYMPARMDSESALTLSKELSHGRKPKPEYPAVEFDADQFLQELLVGAACRHCGEWLDMFTNAECSTCHVLVDLRTSKSCHHCGTPTNPVALAAKHPCLKKHRVTRRKKVSNV